MKLSPRLLLIAAVSGALVGVAFIAAIGAVHTPSPSLFVGGLAAGLTFAVLCVMRGRA